MLMKKVSLVLCLVLVFSLFNSFSLTKGATTKDVLVGVFYYPWYVAGLANGHWNGTASAANPNLPDSWWTVVDEPYVFSNGTHWYRSDDPDVIKQHLDWFKYAGIDFGIISWWGPNSYEDNCTKVIFNVTKNHDPSFKWVISVEGYREGYNDYNFTSIRDYINNTYLTYYDDIWLHYDNKPLLCWMTAPNMTGTATDPQPDNIKDIMDDPIFEPRIVGQDSYVNWTSWRPYRGCNITSTFPPSMNEFIAVMPRYDEKRLDPQRKTGEPYRNITCDPNLDGSDGENVEPLNETPLYDKQWSQAIQCARNGTVKFIAIATWNDFTERTQIEPCNDSTSAYKDNPFFLLNRSAYWVSTLVAAEFSPLIILPLFMIATLVAIIVYGRKRACSEAKTKNSCVRYR